MAAGQPWPLCNYCDTPLSLCLQFDVEEAHQLAFALGSHLLLFHCREDHIPPTFDGPQIPAAWLEPEFRSSCRIILNPPGGHEAIYEPDPTVEEQHLGFSAAKEKLGRGLDGPVGVGKVKLGGVPHWVQPPLHPRCACGAPMGFVMQIPTDESPGWRSQEGSPMPFGGGLSGYIFACTAQSSPYATALIVQR